MIQKKKSKISVPIDGKTVALGFALSNAFMPGTAHGYYMLKWGFVTTTVGGGLWVTSTSTEATSYVPPKKKRPTNRYTPPAKPTPKPPTGPDGDDPTEEEPFIIAQSLMHSALLQSQGDLGMHMKLLAESPTAFAQLSHELSVGRGPAVDALTTATGLDLSVLQSAWRTTKAEAPLVDSQAAATRFIQKYLGTIVPHIEVHQSTQSDLAWRLVREQQRHAVKQGNLATHTWLAQWMGVPADALVDATAQAVSQMDAGSDLREIIYAEPERFFKHMNRSLSQLERASLSARAAQIEALRAQAQAVEKSDA